MKLKWLIAFVLVMAVVIPMNIAGSAAVSDTVRVAVALSNSSMEFVTQGEYQIVEQQTGRVVANTGSNERWRVEMKDGRLFLNGGGNTYSSYSGALAVQTSDSATVSVVAAEGKFLDRISIRGMKAINSSGNAVTLEDQERLRVLSASGSSELTVAQDLSLISLSAGGLKNRYRGDMVFLIEDGMLVAVNRLNIEDYLRGVIAAEMPSDWPAEALKAQAVASRTYALQRAQGTKSDAYDLTGDQYSQMYKGYDGEVSSTNQAVQSTGGVVLLSGGELVQAFFHSSDGGFTENSEDVWLTSTPALKTKADPYDLNDAHYNWQVSYSEYQLIERFKELAKFSSISDIRCVYTASGARVREMTVIGTDRDDYPLQIKIANSDKVRTALGLKSALFTMEKTYDQDDNLSNIRLNGSGYGHGLGMSQYGARSMALQGHDYREILQFYFTDILIRDNYGN